MKVVGTGGLNNRFKFIPLAFLLTFSKLVKLTKVVKYIIGINLFIGIQSAIN